MLHRAVVTLRRSQSLRYRIAGMPHDQAMDAIYTELLGKDWAEQAREDMRKAMQDVEDGLVTGERRGGPCRSHTPVGLGGLASVCVLGCSRMWAGQRCPHAAACVKTDVLRRVRVNRLGDETVWAHAGCPRKLTRDHSLR